MDISQVKPFLKSYCKEKSYKKPKYKVINITTDSYRDYYTVYVEIKGVLIIDGFGISKRFAEKNAAIKALIKLKVVNEKDINSQILNEFIIDEQFDKSDKQLINNNKSGINFENEGLMKINRSTQNIEPKGDYVNNLAQNTPEEKDLIKCQFIDEIIDSNDVKLIDKTDGTLDKISLKRETNYKNNENKLIPQISRFGRFEENAISLLIEFCIKKKIPIPFYDYKYSKKIFHCKCRIELINGDVVEEYLGIGSSEAFKTAKIEAAEEIIKQLKDKNLFYEVFEYGFNAKTTRNMTFSGTSETQRYKKESYFSSDSSIVINNMIGSKMNEEFMKYKTRYVSNGKEVLNNTLSADKLSENQMKSSKDQKNSSENQKIGKNDSKIIDKNLKISSDNPIGYLEEFCFKNSLIPPKYSEEERLGEDHCPVFNFKCQLFIDNKEKLGFGSSQRKKSAKKAAAQDVVTQLFNR